MEFMEVVQELQRQLSDHSVSLHNALQQHMMSLEAKMADLRAEWNHSTSLREGSSSVIPTPLPPDGNGSRSDNTKAYRTMKLEVPRFDGSYPNGWLFCVEAFFDYHNTPDEL